MNQRIRIAELPEFDAAPSLTDETTLAAYLTDILAANDAGLLAAALGDIARALSSSAPQSSAAAHAPPWGCAPSARLGPARR